MNPGAVKYSIYLIQLCSSFQIVFTEGLNLLNSTIYLGNMFGRFEFTLKIRVRMYPHTPAHQKSNLASVTCKVLPDLATNSERVPYTERTYVIIPSLKICDDILVPLASKMKHPVFTEGPLLDYHSIQVKDICNTAAFVFS